MAQFDDREKAQEAKFARDGELRFKAEARRNRLLGMWAAEKLGLSGPAADAYAKEVIIADFEAPGDADVFKKLRTDFDAKEIAVSDIELRKQMDELMSKAVADIKTSG